MADTLSDTMVHLQEVGMAGAYVRPSAAMALVSLDAERTRAAGHPGEIGGTAIPLQGGNRVVVTSAAWLHTEVAQRLGFA